jgi:predicted ATP-dependent endonuclease of OLD family
MRMTSLKIQNFRCCKDVTLKIDSLHALVGANNAGKSTILKALDLLFNPSTTKVSEESFWHKDISQGIWIEGRFVSLTDTEQSTLKGYLMPDGSFELGRSITLGSDKDEDSDSDGGYDKMTITPYYKGTQPQYEWLNDGKINGDAIKKWLKEPEKLDIRGASFVDFLGSKKGVGDWKTKAKEFAKEHLKTEEYEFTWIKNPKGYPSVLKAVLPHFELIPAVREAADESKVLKTNPFGRLISHVIETIELSLKEDITSKLRETTRRLNREADKERLEGVTVIEESMKKFLAEVMPADLEIEFQAPTVETLLSTPKIFIDDGFRGTIDGKGHGLQRAVIFSILRTYAELMTRAKSGADRRSLFLAVEEPELYMHPTAQRMVRTVFKSIAKSGDQIVFSTHSPLLVDVADFDEIIRVASSSGEEKSAGVHVFQLTMDAMLEDFAVMYPKAKNVTAGSIRESYSHAYTPTRNEGFFAKQVMLVEGTTESYCLPIYARTMKQELDILGIAVIDCGGKESIDRLYRIFHELGIPCYVLFDYDDGNKDALEASKELLRFMQHPTDKLTENTHTDHFSCFHIKWEHSLGEEVPNHDKLTSEASKYLGRSGKPLIARYIAMKLAGQTPPFVPPTIKKILENAISVKHRGTCLKKKPQPAGK